jgi:hypothetical protein
MLSAQSCDCRHNVQPSSFPCRAGLVVGSDLGLKRQAKSFRLFGTMRFAAYSPFRPVALSLRRLFAVLQPTLPQSIIDQYARKFGSGGEVFDR